MSNITPAPGTTFEPVELPSKYAKAIVGILTAVLGVVIVAFDDNVVSQAELLNIGIYLLVAIGVYLVPNLPSRTGNALKFWIAVLGILLQAVAGVVTDGITPNEWLLVLLAALGAVGVGVVPNVNKVQVITGPETAAPTAGTLYLK
jgi:hypothetical protein